MASQVTITRGHAVLQDWRMVRWLNEDRCTAPAARKRTNDESCGAKGALVCAKAGQDNQAENAKEKMRGMARVRCSQKPAR
jgi:hypothetical protein